MADCKGTISADTKTCTTCPTNQYFMWLLSEWFGAEVKGCRKCPNTPVNNECKLDVEDCFFTAREEGGKYYGTSLCTEETAKLL